jgi:hypothetical protein
MIILIYGMNIDSSNMVEIFINEITTCVFPHDINYRFYKELLSPERSSLTDSIIEYKDFSDDGEYQYELSIEVGPIKSVGMDYDCEVEGKSILCKIVTFEVES